LGDGMYKVRVDIRNERVIPTITARAMATKAVRPDVLSAEGDVEIVAAGWVVNKHQPGKTKLIDQKELDRILVRSGHPGRTTRTVEYVVRGTGNLNVTYSTVKGGTVSTTVRVR
jgi:hypothetical protein